MSTISVRITLLTLATVMFAVVWSNDHKPQLAKARTVVPFDFSNRCPVGVLEPVRHQALGSEIGIEVAVEEFSPVDVPSTVIPEVLLMASNGSPTLIPVPFPESLSEEPAPLTAEKPDSIMVHELAYPIPADLAPGEYRIVDRFGRVESLEFTEQQLRSWGVQQTRITLNVYDVHRGEDRWHFIRVEQQLGAAPSQKDVAQAWKAVFRFADRTVSPALRKASAPVSRMFRSELDLTGESPEIQ